MSQPVCKESIGEIFSSMVGSTSDVCVIRARERFNLLEQELLKLPQIETTNYQLVERYSGGMYVRQFTMPAGALITGRIYLRDHIEIMVRGDVSSISADGVSARHTGSKILEAKAGKRQAGYAHEETVWITINEVPPMPLDEMLDYTTVTTYAEYEAFHCRDDIKDYECFLAENEKTEDDVRAEMRFGKIADMPEGFEHIYTAPSPINGKGLFSTAYIAEGEMICPTVVGSERTIGGRYSNHALNASARPEVVDGVKCIVATKGIGPDDEITTNYRDVFALLKATGEL